MQTRRTPGLIHRIGRPGDHAPFDLPLLSSLIPTRSLGSPTPTFTRATPATVMGYAPGAVAGDSQVLLTCASGEARFQGARRVSQGVWDANLSDGTPIPSSTLLGYVAEGLRTNLCLQSNAFATTWVAIGTPAVTQDTVGPDGTTSAWTLTDNDSGAVEGIKQDIALTAAPHAFSVFIKKTSGATTFPVLEAITGTVTANCTVNTNNGIATIWTAYTGRTMLASASATCISANADYWRVSLMYTATAATYTHSIFAAATSNATQSSGTIDVTQLGTCVIYGAQVEAGVLICSSSYIATTTASVTRNADALYYSSTGNIADAAGTCFAEVSSSVTNAYAVSTATNALKGAPLTWNLSSIWLADSVGGHYFGNMPFPSTSAKKIVTTWNAANNFSLGGSMGSMGAASTYTGTLVRANILIGFDNLINLTNNIFGTIRNVRIYTRAMSRGELSSLTS